MRGWVGGILDGERLECDIAASATGRTSASEPPWLGARKRWKFELVSMAQLPEMRCPWCEDAVGPYRYRGFGGGGSDETGDDFLGAELGLRRYVGVRRHGVAPGRGEACRGRTGDVVTKATQHGAIVGVHRGAGEDLEAGEFERAALP